MTRYDCTLCKFRTLRERSAMLHLKENHNDRIDATQYTVREARELFLKVSP